ncbi:hypothetical protein PFISCL1PPCAC_6332, partial [Pristionchus fissidentatus]
SCLLSLLSSFSPSFPSLLRHALRAGSRRLLQLHQSILRVQHHWTQLRWERDWASNWQRNSDSCRIPPSSRRPSPLPTSLPLSSLLSVFQSLRLFLSLLLNSPSVQCLNSPMSSFPRETALTAEEIRESRVETTSLTYSIV